MRTIIKQIAESEMMRQTETEVGGNGCMHVEGRDEIADIQMRFVFVSNANMVFYQGISRPKQTSIL